MTTESELSEATERLCSTGWAFRSELAGLAILLVTAAGFHTLVHGSWIGAAALTYALVMLLVAIRPVRRWVVHELGFARTRRQWDLAVGHCELSPVRVMSRAPVPAGDQLKVRVSHGMSFDALEDCSERLAASLSVREVRVERDVANAAKGTVTLVRRDPLVVESAMPWPEPSGLWEPVSLGVDEHGHLVEVSLPERNMLLGGEPGAGKSAALSLLVAAGALDPNVRLFLFDGKTVELAAWEDCAEGVAGPDIDQAIGLLEQIRDEMQSRYDELRAAKLRKVDSSHPLYLVVVDELALFTAGPDKKACERFSGLLRDLVARGRAAGIIVVAATQKPSVDVVPSSLRDLFAFRLALRSTTPQASDTILGQGWASQGFTASSIGPADKGVGYLLHESGLPKRLRTFYLDDSQIRSIADRAHQVRSSQCIPQ